MDVKQYHNNNNRLPERGGFGWLVVFGLNDPLRQYFSPHRAVSKREGEREEKGQTRVKTPKQPPPAPTARAVGPCPTLIQISRTPRHWKFTQDHRTTRPPPERGGGKRGRRLVSVYIGPSPKEWEKEKRKDRGGGRVVRWCWVTFQCRGVLQI